MYQLPRSFVGFMLFGVISASCQQDIEAERREFRGGSDSAAADSISQGSNGDPSFEELINPDFTPENPNQFPSNTDALFPNLSFNLQGVPQGASDFYDLNFPVEADAAISHYAYKLDSSASCAETGGYAVHDVKQALQLSVAEMPDGDVYLCVIAFHFPTKKWQSLGDARVFKWEKIQFKRSISSYYEYDNSQCNRKIRFQAALNIEGANGTYTWTQERVQGCPPDSNTYVDLVSQIKVSNDGMTGLWHEGAMVAGWFQFKFTNPERTQFTGTWGFGQPGVKTEGVWNSNP